MEEASRSDKSCCHWVHTVNVDCTDIDVAEMMMPDEVGPDHEVGPENLQMAAGVAALGHVEMPISVGIYQWLMRTKLEETEG